METDYPKIENDLIEIRNRLPIIDPRMPKKELHHLACLKGALDTAILNLIKLNKIHIHSETSEVEKGLLPLTYSTL